MFNDKSRKDKFHIKSDCILVGVLKGVREPIMFSFVLEEFPGWKLLCEPETIQKKTNKIVLITKTYYVEDDLQQLIYFVRETVTFTLQLKSC